MPRTQLPRKAKKSRVSVYEKAIKESPPPSLPASPKPTADVGTPLSVSMATGSPSMLDLTVTYDYTVDQGSCNHDNLSSDKIFALFPFTESPSTHREIMGRGTSLWKDLGPPANTKRTKPKTERSAGLHQLSVFARTLRETLKDHHERVKESLTFEPPHDCRGRLDFGDEDDQVEAGEICLETSEEEKCVKDFDDGEDDQFWTQAAEVCLSATDTNTDSGDELGSTCDNDFIDRLLSQGIGLDTATRGTGLDAATRGTGLHTATRGTRLDTATRGTGLDTATRGTGLDTATRGTGLDTATRGTGLDTATRGTGLDTATRSTGLDTATRGTGLDTATRGTGLDTATRGTGLDTATRRIGLTTEGASKKNVTTDFVGKQRLKCSQIEIHKKRLLAKQKLVSKLHHNSSSQHNH